MRGGGKVQIYLWKKNIQSAGEKKNKVGKGGHLEEKEKFDDHHIED